MRVVQSHPWMMMMITTITTPAVGGRDGSEAIAPGFHGPVYGWVGVVSILGE